jgi:hypothetical protein
LLPLLPVFSRLGSRILFPIETIPDAALASSCGSLGEKKRLVVTSGALYMQGQGDEDGPLEKGEESSPQSLPKNCAYPGLMAVLEAVHQIPELSVMGRAIGDLKRRIGPLSGEHPSGTGKMSIQAGGAGNFP